MGELASGDYSAFGALIWHRELMGLTLLLLTRFKTILFGVLELGELGC